MRAHHLHFRKTEHQLSSILALQVRCWNQKNGCDFTGTLSDASNHFQGQCKFHQILCPRCDDLVFHRDIFHHIDQTCRQRNVEKSKREEGTLEKLMESQAYLQETLNNLIAKTKDGLRGLEHSVSNQVRELGLVRVKQDEHALSSSAALQDVKAVLEQFPGFIRHQQWIKKTCTNVLGLTSDKFFWSVDNVSHYVENAIDSGSVRINSDCFTFAGYNVRLRVTFSKRLTDLAVAIHLCLCPSRNDDALEWPFKTPFTLALVHPKSSSKSSVKSVHPEDSPFPECFERPLMTENSGVGGSCFTTGRMLAGFVLDDSILVCLERIR
ncbi:uncharacterized protein LOC135389130 [Ornithodoros turicata]|uniref:uncharacterized protein LOC135389130 n=1 Tax=Ornithodoros turicata TaxID=34597 RepID=UPI003139594E